MNNVAKKPAGLDEKRVAVLSDNDRLAQAIELDLRHSLGLEIVTHVLDLPKEETNQVGSDEFDLILVAVSSSTSEPIVMLTRASLVHHIGQIPILVVSDRQFDPEVYHRIFHLRFPVSAGELRNKVRDILRGKPSNL